LDNRFIEDSGACQLPAKRTGYATGGHGKARACRAKVIISWTQSKCDAQGR
jgi:hypothetical protein